MLPTKTTQNEKWACKFCNKSFDSASALRDHMDRTPWEKYMIHLKTKGIFRCKVCKGEYKSKKEFLKHWDESHDSYADEMKWLSGDNRRHDGYVMRPMEEELIKHNLRTEPAYSALKSDFTVNELVISEIEHGIENEAMTVAEIVGIPGAGKSVFALSLARIIQMRWLEKIISLFRDGRIKNAYTPKIYIGFDVDMTLQYLRTAKMGDTIIQDEDPEMMGGHAGTTKSQIENIMKVLRKACINFVFVSPISTPYINMPNLVFEVIAKNKRLRRTKAALYDRKYHAVGWTILKILDEDDPLLVEYEKMKDINLEDIKASGGRRSVKISGEQLMEDVKKLIKYLQSIKYNFTKRHTIADLVEHASAAKVEGDTAYQRFVARTAIDYITQELSELMGYSDDLDEADASAKYLFVKEEKYDDPLFLYDIYNALPEAKKAVELRSAKDPREPKLRKFQDRYAEAWMHYYAEGLPYDAVGDMYGVKGQSIANSYGNHGWNAIFQEEISGDCAENALAKKYFTDFEVIGGFGNPDLVNKNDKTDWIEVKLRRRLSERKEDLIRSFEYEFVDKGGSLRLALITYEQEKCNIQMYRIIKNPAYRTTEEIMEDFAEDEPLEEEETTEDSNEEEENSFDIFS